MQMIREIQSIDDCFYTISEKLCLFDKQVKETTRTNSHVIVLRDLTIVESVLKEALFVTVKAVKG